MKGANWCVKCFKDQSEPAGEQCGNPIWHALAHPLHTPDSTEAVAAARESAAIDAEADALNCWRCGCNGSADRCACCHVEPCELER